MHGFVSWPAIIRRALQIMGTERTQFVGRLENTGFMYMPTALLQKHRVSRSSLVGGFVRKTHIFGGRGQRKQSKEY